MFTAADVLLQIEWRTKFVVFAARSGQLLTDVFSGKSYSGTAILRGMTPASTIICGLPGNQLEIERNDPAKTRNASSPVGQWALSDEDRQRLCAKVTEGIRTNRET